MRQMYEQYYSEVEDNFIPKKVHWKDHDVATRLQFFQRKETKKLCQGTVSFEQECSGAIIEEQMADFSANSISNFRISD